MPRHALENLVFHVPEGRPLHTHFVKTLAPEFQFLSSNIFTLYPATFRTIENKRNSRLTKDAIYKRTFSRKLRNETLFTIAIHVNFVPLFALFHR